MLELFTDYTLRNVALGSAPQCPASALRISSRAAKPHCVVAEWCGA
jgi:hypothetical protein